MSLAIFDLDNTLIATDSDHAWGEFLLSRGAVDPVAFQAANDAFLADYQAGTLDIHAFLTVALAPLADYPLETLNAWHREFMAECIEPHVLPAGLELLDQHRQRGDTLLIITATNRFVTAPIARRLGVDHLIAVEPEVCNGAYTGKVDGVPSFREGKVTRLEAWRRAHQQPLDGAYFYSDSHNDLPLLEAVDHPVAVDPDPTLREQAVQRHWPILSLRDPTGGIPSSTA